MYICVLDAAGEVLFHRNGPTTPKHFLRVIAPYREDIVVAVECMFTWYWLADLCAQEGIPFVLGHALYMKAIHGGKAKNDKIDSHKIAVLLRGGMIPMAYVYLPEMRAARDLLRRRCHFTQKRAEFGSSITVRKALPVQTERCQQCGGLAVQAFAPGDPCLGPAIGRARLDRTCL